MVVDAQRLPVEALARAAASIAATGDLRVALAALAAAVREAARADLAIVRVIDQDELLVARAVAPPDSALGAEVAGTRAAWLPLAAGEQSEAARRAAERARAADVLTLPATADGRVVGAIELIRIAQAFDDADRSAGELAAAQLALAVRTLAPEAGSAAGVRRSRWLELAGEALSAGGDPERASHQAVRAAVEATRARAGALWRIGATRPELVASDGVASLALDRAAEIAAEVVATWRPVSVEHWSGLPDGAAHAVTLPLGQPAFAVLQLFYAEETVPQASELPGLASFAARTAHALRVGDRARELEQELERTQALLEVVAEAISRLSLAHTLETGVERISNLLQVDRVAVYLREEHGELATAAGRGLAPGHEEVAARLLEALHGPLRARASIHAGTDEHDPALGGVRAALRRSGLESAVAVPLRVGEESIGLLAAYPGEQALSEGDVALLTALAAQLAVAVQNARLHERATELGEALGAALQSERQASRQVNALYEISRSFAQTLSLDSTLAAITETLVRELEVDAAVIRVPDDRGDLFVPRAVHVAESRLAEAVRTILDRPQPRPPRSHEPLLLDIAAVERLGGAHALLRPFLEKGSSAALLPIATPTELLAELTILSLDPASSISGETLATARTIAQQAALAIDNARLYHQQKLFAETMQRSLLPRDDPSVEGLEVGCVYESAAQVDVGGDVYDFLELADGRLAVVLGDVTGHGIDATADMAMAKFVFRSLAREHSEPSAFLARANDVVLSEIAAGKFITMVYVTVDRDGALACACAGHPQPRLLGAAGVSELACGGLALGIDAPQEYEQVTATLQPGGAVVLFTDGVIECRRDGELFGDERLDGVLAANAGRSAQEIAEAVVAACRAFAGGDLPDDCAVVVIRRLA